MKYSCFFILILICYSPFLLGNKCTELEESLKQAERSYTDGNMYQAISLLEHIQEKKLSSNCPEVWRDAFLLLSKVYLLTNEGEKAAENYKQVLKIAPSYKVNKELEPIEVVYFADRYRATPKFLITPTVSLALTSNKGASIGQTVESIRLAENEELEDVTSDNGLWVPGIGASVSASYFPTRHWEVTGRLGVENLAYLSDLIYERDDNAGNVEAANEVISIEEAQRWISITGLVKYNIGKKNLTFNVFCGIGLLGLNRAEFLIATRDDFDLLATLATKEDLDVPYFPEGSNLLDVTSLRNRVNYSHNIGLGLRYRPKNSRKNLITLDLRYVKLMDNFNEKFNDDTIEYPELRNLLLYSLGYSENNMKLNYIQFSLGYSYAFYKEVRNDNRFSLF